MFAAFAAIRINIGQLEGCCLSCNKNHVRKCNFCGNGFCFDCLIVVRNIWGLDLPQVCRGCWTQFLEHISGFRNCPGEICAEKYTMLDWYSARASFVGKRAAHKVVLCAHPLCARIAQGLIPRNNSKSIARVFNVPSSIRSGEKSSWRLDEFFSLVRGARTARQIRKELCIMRSRFLLLAASIPLW